MTEYTASAPDAATRDLEGQVLLMTGATGGIGSALATACALRRATVIACGKRIPALNSLADEIVAAGGVEPLIYPIDLAGASEQDYCNLIESVSDNLGRLDAVIHLATRFKGLTPLALVDPQDWQDSLQIAVTAPWLINRAAQPLLCAASPGRIVFALDDPDLVARPYMGPYGIGKAGVDALCRMTAEEFESSGVQVHGVFVGAVMTSHRKKIYVDHDPADLKPVEVAVAHYLSLLSS